MTDIQITIDSAQVEALLSHIQGKADHLQPVMAAIGHDITERVKLGFRDLKSPYGNAWKPLSNVTRFKRAERVAGGRDKVYRKDGKGARSKFTRAYLSATPLNDMGNLKKSIHYTASAEMVEVGTNLPYAAMMNFGGKRSNFKHLWGDIPARQFMPTDGLPDEWEQSIIDRINDYLGVL